MSKFVAAIALATVVALPTAAGAFDFKGVQLGQPATPQMIQQKLGVSCGEGWQGSWVCNGSLTIANAPADMNLVIGQSGNVQRIGLDFFTMDYTAVEKAVHAKFGPPTDTAIIPLQNAFGARFESLLSVWEAPAGRIEMKSGPRWRDAGDKATISFYSREYMAEREAERGRVSSDL